MIKHDDEEEQQEEKNYEVNPSTNLDLEIEGLADQLLKKQLQILISEYYDLESKINISLGESYVSVLDLLNLKIGDVIELNKTAGDNADIYVQNQFISRAEILVFEDVFVLRLNELASYKNIFNKLSPLYELNNYKSIYLHNNLEFDNIKK